MATKTIKTQFGKFIGQRRDRVVQYLGLKYANLKDRLSVPEMVEGYGSEVVDCTQYGPRCISQDLCEFELDVLIQKRIKMPTPPPMSGLNGLNLNITVPDIKIDKPLPVMVFIHGGGFIMGANWWPQYDPARLIKLSVESGMPVVCVNINFRLGVYGNLTSEKLRKAGYPGNNSLRDQRCALQWVRSYIEGFGGDAGNVLAFGESAGAVSVLNQLYSKEPLFKRAISMSGTPFVLKPLDPSVTENAYSAIMKELRLENACIEEQIERLLTIDEHEIASKTPMTVPLKPFVDGDIIPTDPSFKDLAKGADDSGIPGTQWCEELMIGDCQHDGTVYLYMGLLQRKSAIGTAFHTTLHKNLCNPAAAAAILDAYAINPSTPDDTALASILGFANDIGYHLPARAYAQFWPGEIYRYQFDEPNPWDGMLKGKASHLLDAVFSFQNFKDEMEERGRGVAEAMGRDFIRFANGVGVKEGRVRVYGGGGEEVVRDVENGEGRRDVLIRLAEDGVVDLDEVSRAWDLFVEGR